MSDPLREHDYLWHRSAPADPEIERLERILSPLRYSAPHEAGRAEATPPHLDRLRPRPLLALAATIAVVFLLAWLFADSEAPNEAGWTVDALSGNVRINADLIGEAGRLEVGQSLETGSASRSRLAVADIGSLTVHPNSRLRLLRSNQREHRLALDRGRIDALIHAPPRLFFVDTPSAVAVDLGCAYSLSVDDDGSGRIEVSFGWVALEDRGVVSTIPTDGACFMHPEHGPGTPFFQDAPDAFIEALRRFDFEADVGEAVTVILRSARSRDTLTLWHLLHRVAEHERAAVAQRITELATLPAGVTEEALGSLDENAMDRTWSFLERSW